MDEEAQSRKVSKLLNQCKFSLCHIGGYTDSVGVGRLSLLVQRSRGKGSLTARSEQKAYECSPLIVNYQHQPVKKIRRKKADSNRHSARVPLHGRKTPKSENWRRTIKKRAKQNITNTVKTPTLRSKTADRIWIGRDPQLASLSVLVFRWIPAWRENEVPDLCHSGSENIREWQSCEQGCSENCALNACWFIFIMVSPFATIRTWKHHSASFQS